MKAEMAKVEEHRSTGDRADAQDSVTYRITVMEMATTSKVVTETAGEYKRSRFELE